MYIDAPDFGRGGGDDGGGLRQLQRPLRERRYQSWYSSDIKTGELDKRSTLSKTENKRT